MNLMLTDLLWWFGLGLLAYSWWHGRGLKDGALRAVKQHCDEQDLQLLDQTLILSSFRPQLSRDSLLCLRRRYRFEFSSTGDERYQGIITLEGKRIKSIDLDPHRMPL